MSLSYVSLFSSAGLGCFGFNQAGYECVATAELLPRRLEVQRANEVATTSSAYVLGDLATEEVKTNLVRRIRDWESGSSCGLTAVVATPPCQGISVANHKKGNELPRNSLVVESLALIDEIRPRYFVLENVRGFLKAACLDRDAQLKSIESAIKDNLEAAYNIESRIINFKDFGAPSSRTRTLVIGVRRDIRDVSPSDLFPEQKSAPTLYELIGHLPSLSEMGEISASDIYHGFRRYDERMRPWITELKDGQSAFDNTDPAKRPHRFVNGRRVENKASNGDKYRRAKWERVAPCVHTRNDILASQTTIHPSDDRVFSITELSLMMGVPAEFKWSQFDRDELNRLPISEKTAYLREHELNIRQCLGEGVPTPIFREIARKGATVVSGNGSEDTVGRWVRQKELANERREELAAYYTRQDVAFDLVEACPSFSTKRRIRLLEPSVGAGAFVPHLIRKYSGREVELHLMDIDPEAIRNAQSLVAELSPSSHMSIFFHVGDFLAEEFETPFDLIIGNPPFGKRPSKRQQEAPQKKGVSRDLFAQFTAKALRDARHVAFILPKSLLGGPDFRDLRQKLSTVKLDRIVDYGETAFSDIKIETLGINVSCLEAPGETRIVSLPLGSVATKPQTYITSAEFPVWLIYRNHFFDEVSGQLELGAYEFVRDRELTSKHFDNRGTVPVLRARNIPYGDREPAPIQYLADRPMPASSRKYSSRDDALIVPNLSYYPRAMRLPQGAVVDGSAVVLLPKERVARRASAAIEFFGSDTFFYYYRIARNYSTRSLNVDSSSVHFWGVPTEQTVLSREKFAATSKNLFEIPESLSEMDRFRQKSQQDTQREG